MKGIIGFFKQNPNSLISLVPKEMEEEFYSMIRKTAELNLELNEEPTLTKVQIIEIAKELNYRVSTNNYTDNIFMITKNWGKICLN
jgi:hypothetical protein